VAIGRAADFYGPGVTNSAMGDMVCAALVAGKTASVMGNPDLLHTYSYIEDVGQGLATLGTRPEAAGEIWHLPVAPAVTTREMLRLGCQQEGLHLRLKAMGRMMLRIGGLFVPAARESVEMLYQWEAPFVVDDSKFRRTFGSEATPVFEGMAKTLAWFRMRRAA
jgi:nucleoside-diphosphate-sugar epimerase